MRGLGYGSRPSLEVRDRRHNSHLIGFGKIIIERQAKQAIAHVLGYRTIPFPATESLAHDREMEGLVMKNAIDVPSVQVGDHCLALLERG